MLTRDQKLWLLTAHPDTWELSEDPPDWLARECNRLGLVEPSGRPGIWKLTAKGHPIWRDLRGLG